MDDYTADLKSDQEGEKKQSKRIPIWVVLFMLAVLVLDAISMIRFPDVMRDYKVYIMAEEKIENGETQQTLNDLFTMAEKHSSSAPVIIKSIDLCMKNGYYDMAAYLQNEYLYGKELSDLEYNRMNAYYDQLEAYYITWNAIEQIYIDAPQDTMDESYYKENKKKLEQLLKDETQYQPLVYYYLGLTEADTKSSIHYLKQCYNLDPELYDIRVQLGLRYRRLGDLIRTKQLNIEALSKEKADFGALRSMAIIKLLEEDMANGLTFAKEAYESSKDGLYVLETYMIALYFNGEKEEAQVIRNEIIELQGALDEDTEQLLDGKLTLYDYYIGEGE